MKMTLALCLITGFAPPVSAENLFPRDTSCKHMLTVQYRTCRVKTYFLCGESGEIIRAEEVRPKFPRKATVYTPDLHLIGTEDELGKLRIAPISGADSTLDMSAILSGEPQTYTQEIELRMFGMTRSGPYVGTVKVLPGTMTIDGVEFSRIEEQADWALPQPIGTISGNQVHYINERVGFPLLGEGSVGAQGSKKVNDIVPAEIIFPEEAGFESEEPRYNCERLSSLAIPEAESKA